MCMGRKKKARAKAAAAQAEADALAAKNQAIVDAQNEQFALEQANQQLQLENFNKAQETIIAKQNEVTSAFSAAQSKQDAWFAAEQKRLQEVRLANQTVTNSLKVLATKDNKDKAPHAGVAPGKKDQANQARYNSPTKNLKVGFSPKKSGVGVNLGA